MLLFWRTTLSYKARKRKKSMNSKKLGNCSGLSYEINIQESWPWKQKKTLDMGICGC